MIKPYYETTNGKLYNANCLDVLPELERVDMVFADPPYYVEFQYQEKDSKFEYIKPCILHKAIMNKTSLFLITPGIKEYPKWAVLDPLWQYGWFKPGSCRRSKLKGFNTWEPILIFGEIKKPVWQDAIRLPDCNNHIKGKSKHPCPKPLTLLMSLIDDFTEKGNICLDPFMGSGTTAVACERLNRRWIGIEISLEYCRIAKERIEIELQQKKIPGF